jgi:6-phosphogluconolactonase
MHTILHRLRRPLFLAAGLALTGTLAAAPRELTVYFGTYTRGASQGIYVARLHLETGALTRPELAAASTNPSFLALHPNGRFLYAVNEVSAFAGEKTGAVSAFAIDPVTRRLTLLNQQPSRGAGPCHLMVDKRGAHVLVANYGSGTVAVLPIGRDGRLGAPTSFARHTGSSVNPRRQQEPHAHTIQLDPANRFAVAADLGADKLFLYRFDGRRGTLSPHDPPHVALPPGSGPRHFAFRPDGRFAWGINELLSTLTVFRYEARRGTLTPMQTVSTLPPDFTGNNTTAEVVVHPSGRFVYGSNRGHDSVAVFAADRRTGELTLVEHEPTLGRTPRNIAIAPGGRWLLAANQGSDNVVVFRIDPATGALSPGGHTLSVPAPVCVRFLPPTR